ncbi:MAG: NUDIX domain-containing protein [Candidatus Absconditabacteria bacterium]
MPRVTLVVLFNDNNEVLLAMKKRGHGAGKWNGFGGKPDGDETVLQTAVRELYEESGVSLQETELQKCGLLHFIFDEQSHLSKDCYVFKAKYNGSFQETDEMAPKRRKLDNIPYHEMRKDDEIRFKQVLDGTQFDITKYCK